MNSLPISSVIECGLLGAVWMNTLEVFIMISNGKRTNERLLCLVLDVPFSREQPGWMEKVYSSSLRYFSSSFTSLIDMPWW